MVTKRYFIEGPNGAWRQDARCICIDFEQGHDAHTGRLILRSGKVCSDVTYSSVAIIDNLARGEWLEATGKQINRLIGNQDRPKTVVEQVW